MTNAILNNVSYNDLQAFLTPYHQRLHSVEGFPPLNPNKAMHIAAKSMGLKNAHVMKAYMDSNNAASAEGTVNPAWGDDALQFARLTAEISMAADGEEVNLNEVAESMDLDMAELYSLFARAEHAFEAIKQGEYQPQAPTPEPKNDSVIIIVFNEKEDGSGGSATYTDMEVAKNWDAAKVIVADRVYNKGMARADADQVEELLEFSRLCLPDDDDMEEIDMESAESVLDWLIANNDVYDLALYLEYLDYDLTTVSMEEKFLD